MRYMEYGYDRFFCERADYEDEGLYCRIESKKGEEILGHSQQNREH